MMKLIRSYPMKSIWIEGADGDIRFPMVVNEETEVSGGKYIHQPSTEDRSIRLLGEKGKAVFTFDIPVQGWYRLWARVYYIDIDGNSWFCSIDDLTPTVLGNELRPLNQWHWIKGDLWNLDEGSHTLSIKTRENGSRLDQMVITSWPDYVVEFSHLGVGKIEISPFSIFMKNHLFERGTPIRFVATSSFKKGEDREYSSEFLLVNETSKILVRKKISPNREYSFGTDDLKDGKYSITIHSLNKENRIVHKTKTPFFIIPPIDEIRARCADCEQAPSALPTIEEWIHETNTKPFKKRNDMIQAGQKIHRSVNDIMGGRDPFTNITGWLMKAYLSSIDDHREPYLLHIPENYDRTKKYPLMIYLHGVTRGAGHLRYMLEELAGVNADQIQDRILLAVQGRGTLWYDHMAEEDLFTVLKEVHLHYSIDPDRIYLWGQSMGGYGTYNLACKYPDVWAAMAPCAGGATKPLLENLIHIPIRIYHGEKDVLIPVREAQEAYSTLQPIHPNSNLTIFPEGDHQTDEVVVKDPDFWKWFVGLKRMKYPDHVVYNTYTLRHNKAYWITIDAFEDYSLNTPSRVEVIVKDRTRIEIRTSNVSKLSLDATHLLRNNTKNLDITINGKPHSMKVDQNGKITFDLIEFPEKGLDKKHGLSGPLGDQFYDRFLLVFGTGDKNNINQNAATDFSKWKSWETTCDLKHTIKSEDDITLQDLQNTHLVLFGTPWNSHLLAQISKDLPVLINKKSIVVGNKVFQNDFGIRMIYPNPLNPSKYVVIYCGLTPEMQNIVSRWKVTEQIWRKLPDMEILANNGKVVFHSTFDHHWKLRECRASQKTCR